MLKKNIYNAHLNKLILPCDFQFMEWSRSGVSGVGAAHPGVHVTKQRRGNVTVRNHNMEACPAST